MRNFIFTVIAFACLYVPQNTFAVNDRDPENRSFAELFSIQPLSADDLEVYADIFYELNSARIHIAKARAANPNGNTDLAEINRYGVLAFEVYIRDLRDSRKYPIGSLHVSSTRDDNNQEVDHCLLSIIDPSSLFSAQLLEAENNADSARLHTIDITDPCYPVHPSALQFEFGPEARMNIIESNVSDFTPFNPEETSGDSDFNPGSDEIKALQNIWSNYSRFSSPVTNDNNPYSLDCSSSGGSTGGIGMCGMSINDEDSQ